MDIPAILEILKELTLDLESGKRKRTQTVIELNTRIDSNLVYDLPENEPQREFITQVFVSLDNLVTPEFAPSPAEIKYFAECFEGKRQFNLAEVREFEIGSYEKEGLTKETPEPLKAAIKPSVKTRRKA